MATSGTTLSQMATAVLAGGGLGLGHDLVLGLHRFFEAYVLTLGFGLLLYVADIISDFTNAAIYLMQGHHFWGLQTIGTVSFY